MQQFWPAIALLMIASGSAVSGEQALLHGSGCEGALPIGGGKIFIELPLFGASSGITECNVSIPINVPAGRQPLAISPHIKVQVTLPVGKSAALEILVAVQRAAAVGHKRRKAAVFRQKFDGPRNGVFVVTPDGFLPSAGFCGGKMQVSILMRLILSKTAGDINQRIAAESLSLDAASAEQVTLVPCSK